jgi:hypothetical protein
MPSATEQLQRGHRHHKTARVCLFFCEKIMTFVYMCYGIVCRPQREQWLCKGAFGPNNVSADMAACALLVAML